MLNDKERKLIAKLRNNGREKIKTIADENHIPTSSLFDTLNRLENNQLIEHKTHVVFEKVGFPARFLVALKTTTQNRENLKLYLQTSKNVNTIHEINSGFDFHIDCIFKNQKEAHDFLINLEIENTLTGKHIFQVINTIHQERFLTKEDHFH